MPQGRGKFLLAEGSVLGCCRQLRAAVPANSVLGRGGGGECVPRLLCSCSLLPILYTSAMVRQPKIPHVFWLLPLLLALTLPEAAFFSVTGE